MRYTERASCKEDRSKTPMTNRRGDGSITPNPKKKRDEKNKGDRSVTPSNFANKSMRYVPERSVTPKNVSRNIGKSERVPTTVINLKQQASDNAHNTINKPITPTKFINKLTPLDLIKLGGNLYNKTPTKQTPMNLAENHKIQDKKPVTPVKNLPENENKFVMTTNTSLTVKNEPGQNANPVPVQVSTTKKVLDKKPSVVKRRTISSIGQETNTSKKLGADLVIENITHNKPTG